MKVTSPRSNHKPLCLLPCLEMRPLPCYVWQSAALTRCFPNASQASQLRRTIVKAPLSLTYWQESTCQLLKWLVDVIPPFLMEMWKVWVPAFHKESCQWSWLQPNCSSQKKKNQKRNKTENPPSGDGPCSDYFILIMSLGNRSGEARRQAPPQS